MKRILVLALALTLAGCFELSDGQRTGTVVKLSKRGWFCKTWEGQMYLGGLKKQTTVGSTSNGDTTTSTSMVANTFEFTVENPKLIPILQAKMQAAEPVTVTYREEAVSFCRSDSDSYFVTDVK